MCVLFCSRFLIQVLVLEKKLLRLTELLQGFHEVQSTWRRLYTAGYLGYSEKGKTDLEENQKGEGNRGSRGELRSRFASCDARVRALLVELNLTRKVNQFLSISGCKVSLLHG